MLHSNKNKKYCFHDIICEWYIYVVLYLLLIIKKEFDINNNNIILITHEFKISILYYIILH